MIVLEKQRWAIDVWRFEDLVSTVRSIPEEEVVPRLWEALSIYRGDFCENDDYPWVEGWRERYRNLLVTAAAQLAERLDASGDGHEAIRVLDRTLGFVPLCEDLHRRVISLEAKGGRRNEAEVRYQQLISKLADELGEDPEPETEKLIRQVRRGQLLRR